MATAKKQEVRSREGRTPINGSRNIMTVSGIDEEKFHPCWVNDTDDNLFKYIDAGYEFVLDDGTIRVGDRSINRDSQLGTKVSKNVGNGITAYLMVIPKEYYEEDLAQYSKTIDDTEQDMLANAKQAVEGGYGSVKLSRG